MRKRQFFFQTLECRALLAGDVVEIDRSADLNHDGAIDQADVRLIVDWLSAQPEQVQLVDPNPLDLNGDGYVTAADALRVINHVGRDPGGESEAAAANEWLVAAAEGPSISILDAEVIEGHAGVTSIEFTVSLSVPASETVRVDVSVADDSAAALHVEQVAAGLNKPVFVTTAPGDPGLLLVVEQGGQIKVLDLATKTVRGTPFLTVPDLSQGGERGLLGLAFHPEYATNRLFYIYMTDAVGASLVREYQATADGSSADPQSARRVLGFSQPFSNHNGGWMAFGPDGYLYIASGDGGSRDDPFANGQVITDNWLGKMLRIDVNGDDFPADTNRNYAIPPSNPFVGQIGDDEIWAYGLRNPWRSSFDRETGDFYIADVGQDAWEEINVQPGDGEGGDNYGWRPREGLVPTLGVGSDKPPGAIDPIHVYQHGLGVDQGFSVTGGYVYRGPIQELRGNYFFADYVRSRIWSLRYNGDAPAVFDGTNYNDFTRWQSLFRPDVGQISSISSFGEDADGNLYILDYGGEIFRLTGGGDYLPSTTTTLEFANDETTKTFRVDVLGDRLAEANETFRVSLANPVNATIDRGQATGRILNDDPPRVESVVVNRGDTQRSIVDQVTVTFDSLVEFNESAGSAFAFRNLDSLATVDHVKSVSALNGKTVVSFQFLPGPSVLERGAATATLADGNYELQVIGSRVEIGGVAMDGDEDGLAGGDYQYIDQFYRKFGDENANGIVELLDFSRFRRSYGLLDGDASFLGGFDANGNGSIDLIDFAAFRRNFGT